MLTSCGSTSSLSHSSEQGFSELLEPQEASRERFVAMYCLILSRAWKCMEINVGQRTREEEESGTENQNLIDKLTLLFQLAFFCYKTMSKSLIHTTTY